MAKRERTYFKQISLFHARCIYVAYRSSTRSLYVQRRHRPPPPPRCSSKGLLASFFSGVSNLKGLKRFPRGWSVGLSALERRSTDDNSFSPLCYYPRPSVRSRVDPFFTLSIVPVVTYCELLRGPLCRKKKRAVSFTPFVWADMYVSGCVFVCDHHRRGKFRLT